MRTAALCVLVLVLLPAGASAARRDAATLTIGAISASFAEAQRETTYTVPTVEDVPGAKISYRWTLSLQAVDPTQGIDSACNNHGVLTGTAPAFVWHHGNEGDPVANDHCDHAKQGTYGHQGLITVVVSDDRGRECTATYKGTESSSAGSVAAGVASEPECGAATTAPPCSCTRLTARIVPKSVRVGGGGPNFPFELHFRVLWFMTCLRGSGGCSGRIAARAPRVAGPQGYRTTFFPRRVRTFKLLCHGRCLHVNEGHEELTLVSSSANLVGSREGESIPIVLSPTCQERRLPQLRLRIAFDARGDVDLARSKLG